MITEKIRNIIVNTSVESEERRFGKQTLDEALITFGGKAYPKFGNIVILAGGAGSGKGFVKDKLMGIEGFVFDVDKLKNLVRFSIKIAKRLWDEHGVDINTLRGNNALKNSENVSKLHEIVADYLNLDNKRLAALYTSVLTANPDRKPNLIFDVTLSSLTKLYSLTEQVSQLGYEKKSIHIVWVVNDIEVAKEQNAKRERVVPTEILVNTHRGASHSLNDIVNMGSGLTRYMDGDIVFAFNKVGIDSELVRSKNGGGYIKKSNYFYVKRVGRPPTPSVELSQEIRNKIRSYVPREVQW